MQSRHTGRRTRWEIVLAPVALAGLYWVLMGRYLNGDHSLAVFKDHTFMYNPLLRYMSACFASGEYPNWMGSVVGGLALYEHPQISPSYPLYFLRWGLFQTPCDALVQVHRIILLHHYLLLVNAYVMLRVLGLRIVPSAVGAALMAFSQSVYSMLPWLTLAAGICWMPLTVASVAWIVQGRRPAVAMVLGVASISLTTFAMPGHPLIFSIYIVAVLACGCLLANRKQRALALPRAGWLALMAIGALVMTAPRLLPIVQFMRESIRWLGDEKFVTGSEPIPLAAMLHPQYELAELANVLFPLRRPMEIGNSHLGTLPALLAFLSLFLWRKHWIVAPLWFLAVYSLLSATGENLGLVHLNRLLPLLNKIREPTYFTLPFVIAASALAAFGLQHVSEWLRELRAPKWPGHAAVLFVFAFLLGLGYRTAASQPVLPLPPILDEPGITSRTMGLWTIAGGLGIGGLLRVFGRRLPGTVHEFALGSIAVSAAALLPAPIPEIERGDYLREPNLRTHRVLTELAGIEDLHQFRVAFQDDGFAAQWCMNASYYDIRSFQGYVNPLRYRQFEEMFSVVNRPHHARLDGLKYLLCPTSQVPRTGHPPRPALEYRFVREFEGYALYATDEAKPRCFLESRIQGVYSTAWDFFAKVEADSRYDTGLFVHESDRDALAAFLGTPEVPAVLDLEEIQHTYHTLEYATRTDARSVFVLNEYFHEAWNFTLDGRSVDPIRVNLNQMGVMLPPGEHRVRARFRPMRMVWMKRVRLCVLLASGVVLALCWRGGRMAWRRRETGTPWRAQASGRVLDRAP